MDAGKTGAQQSWSVGTHNEIILPAILLWDGMIEVCVILHVFIRPTGPR